MTVNECGYDSHGRLHLGLVLGDLHAPAPLRLHREVFGIGLERRSFRQICYSKWIGDSLISLACIPRHWRGTAHRVHRHVHQGCSLSTHLPYPLTSQIPRNLPLTFHLVNCPYSPAIPVFIVLQNGLHNRRPYVPPTPPLNKCLLSPK